MKKLFFAVFCCLFSLISFSCLAQEWRDVALDVVSLEEFQELLMDNTMLLKGDGFSYGNWIIHEKPVLKKGTYILN